jgi:hypothetical protein
MVGGPAGGGQRHEPFVRGSGCVSFDAAARRERHGDFLHQVLVTVVDGRPARDLAYGAHRVELQQGPDPLRGKHRFV